MQNFLHEREIPITVIHKKIKKSLKQWLPVLCHFERTTSAQYSFFPEVQVFHPIEKIGMLNLWQISRRMAHFLLSSREWGRPAQSCSEWWCCPGIKVQLVECILPNALHPTSHIHTFRLIRMQVSSTTQPNSSLLIDWLNSCLSFLSMLLAFDAFDAYS